MKIEIERKFLLKSIPEKKPDEVIEIEQWYLKNSYGIWERVRKCVSSKNNTYYIHTVKRTISRGVNMEDENLISKIEFDDFISNCNLPNSQSRYITKERWCYQQNELKWEVDIFHSGHHLVIAEIEIPKKSYKITIPNFIKEKLLLEVTGMKQFSNKNLSNSINKTS